ncbi:MAG: UDP-3-O-acyl-N-acetylglucosamine deacetylase [Candidatus Marinimicrobia bacterium]|nr:UDP-3-O-acyl-N-acetylglucosamine deacetylase [Candidatus Neomarinimicrobiota bacterium]
MSSPSTGRLLDGDPQMLATALRAWAAIPPDLTLTDEGAPPVAPRRRTLAQPVSVTGPGTFFGKTQRTLRCEPSDQPGWWIQRTDQPDSLPTQVSIRNVWTTGEIVSNIVLRSGSPHNYLRMVEHLIALRLGLELDDLLLKVDASDPPLFDRGSLDLAEGLLAAGFREREEPARFVTVREPVSLVAPNGAFLVLRPPADDQPRLWLDCAIDFPNAIGRQRLRIPLTPAHFMTGAVARTNTTAAKKWYCRTIGKLFADIRNLGYTEHNVLVAGRRRYMNAPRLLHDGKSLEAVWHRAVLDLLAALALVEDGRLVGEVTSYKAGHALDVKCVTRLYQQDLLTPFIPG